MMIKLVILDKIYHRSKNQLKMRTFFFIRKYMMNLAPNLNLQNHQKKVNKNIILGLITFFKNLKEAKVLYFIKI